MSNIMGLVQRLQAWVRKYDSISSYTDRIWRFHELDSPFPWRGGGYCPVGRFVFYRQSAHIDEVVQALIAQIREGRIRAFKYAKRPLLGEEGQAIVVYAREVDKQRAQSALEVMGVTDYEWREGNPTRFNQYAR